MSNSYNVLIERLYDEHKVMVYKIAYLYLRNVNDAEECMQSVFCLALKKGHELQIHTHPEYWLMRAARNISLSMLRKKKKLIYFDVDSPVFEEYLSEDGFEEQLIERLVSEKLDINAMVSDVLLKLSEKDRYLYHLRYVIHMDIEEISEVLHISYSSVTTRLFRLKERITNQVKKLKLE